MNNRTEAKLTDLIGMQKAIEEILKQAWERGRKYGQNEGRPTDEWVVDEFGRKICCKCQFPFAEFQSDNYCSLCGAKMKGGAE